MATKEELIEMLNGCLSKFHNSTAQYILDAEPYVSDRDRDALAGVGQVATEDRKRTIRLTRFIEELEGIPQVGVPDPMLGDLNYSSFPFLLDVLIRDIEKELPLYGKHIEDAEDFPSFKSLLEEILTEHQAHLKKLKGIREKRYKED